MHHSRHAVTGLTTSLSVAAALMLTACGALDASAGAPPADCEKRRYAFDGPVIESVDQLAREAVIVAEGTLDHIIEHTSDAQQIKQPAEASSAGLPLAIWQFTVDDAITGEAPSSTLYVAQIDSDCVDSPDVPVIKNDTESVLFLREVPGTYKGEQLFALVGDAQGVIFVHEEGSLEGTDPNSQLGESIDAVGTVEALNSALGSSVD